MSSMVDIDVPEKDDHSDVFTCSFSYLLKNILIPGVTQVITIHRFSNTNIIILIFIHQSIGRLNH